MELYECYYLDGLRAGEIETSGYKFREGLELRPLLGSSRKQPGQAQKPLYYRYHLVSHGRVYCVASNQSQLSSSTMALEQALQAGLKPFN